MAVFKSTSDLIAGNSNAAFPTQIGTVTVSYNSSTDELNVVYQLADDMDSDSSNDWRIDEFHFDFGSNPNDIPTNRAGNPVIGRFDYSSNKTPYTYTEEERKIEFTISNVELEIDENGKLVGYWAAHANTSTPGVEGLYTEALATPSSATIVAKSPNSTNDTGDPSYFDTTISNSTVPWLNGTFDGWCVDTDATIQPGKTYNNAIVHSSLDEDSLSGLVDKWKNLSSVNWLINNFKAGDVIEDMYSYGSATAAFDDYANGGPLEGQTLNTVPVDPLTGQRASWTITKDDMQRAIWVLIENSFGSAGGRTNSVIDELADRAYFSGAEYIPPCDGEVAVVLEVPPTSTIPRQQTTIIELPYGSIGMSCSRDETAWGVMNDGNTFTGNSWADLNSFGSAVIA